MTPAQLRRWTAARHLYHLAAAFPGKKMGFYANRFGVTWGQVHSMLMTAERYGFLFYEDDGTAAVYDWELDK